LYSVNFYKQVASTGLEETGGCHHYKQNAPAALYRIFGVAIMQHPKPL